MVVELVLATIASMLAVFVGTLGLAIHRARGDQRFLIAGAITLGTGIGPIALGGLGPGVLAGDPVSDVPVVLAVGGLTLAAVAVLWVPAVDTRRSRARTAAVAIAVGVIVGAVSVALRPEVVARSVPRDTTWVAMFGAAAACVVFLGAHLLLTAGPAVVSCVAVPVLAAAGALGELAVGGNAAPALAWATIAVGLVVATVGLGRNLVAAAAVERERVREAAAQAERAHREAFNATTSRDDLAHQTRATLLGVEAALRALDDEPDEELRAALQQELERLRGRLAPAPAAEPASAYALASAVWPAVALHRAQGQRVQLHGLEGLWAEGRPDDLAEAVGELLDNAAKHAPGATVHLVGTRTAGSVHLEVRDDGPGTVLGTGALARGASTSGSGLGLDIVTRLVTSQGGTVRVLDRPSGFAVLLELPAAERPASSASSRMGPR